MFRIIFLSLIYVISVAVISYFNLSSDLTKSLDEEISQINQGQDPSLEVIHHVLTRYEKALRGKLRRYSKYDYFKWEKTFHKHQAEIEELNRQVYTALEYKHTSKRNLPQGVTPATYLHMKRNVLKTLQEIDIPTEELRRFIFHQVMFAGIVLLLMLIFIFGSEQTSGSRGKKPTAKPVPG